MDDEYDGIDEEAEAEDAGPIVWCEGCGAWYCLQNGRCPNCGEG